MDESLLLGLYTADGMQKVDGLAIQGIGIPGGHLMERAGLAVATEILERYAPEEAVIFAGKGNNCLLYTSPSPRDRQKSRMPSSA